MSAHDVTSQVEELLGSGMTGAELDMRLPGVLLESGGRWEALGWQTVHRLDQLVETVRARKETRARQAGLEAGSRYEWRKAAGRWLIAGKILGPGEVVRVTRADGTTSLEVVGEIVGEADGLDLALPGRIGGPGGR